MKRPRWWEYLVCLPIVVIIGLVLWPVFAQEKGSRHDRCLSNLKGLGIALIIYATDFDDRPPPRDVWLDAIYPYTKNHTIEHCDLVTGEGLSGYALNAGVTDLSDKVKNAATEPLVYDSVNLARNASDLFTSLPKPGRHRGGNFVVFADDHAKFIKSR
jgi:hypothetical protein